MPLYVNWISRNLKTTSDGGSLGSLVAPSPLAILSSAVLSWHKVSTPQHSGAKELLPHCCCLPSSPHTPDLHANLAQNWPSLKMTNWKHCWTSSVDSFITFTVLWNNSASGRNLFEQNIRKTWGGEEEEREATNSSGWYCHQGPHLRKPQNHSPTFSSPCLIGTKIFHAVEFTGAGYPDSGLHSSPAEQHSRCILLAIAKSPNIWACAVTTQIGIRDGALLRIVSQ